MIHGREGSSSRLKQMRFTQHQWDKQNHRKLVFLTEESQFLGVLQVWESSKFLGTASTSSVFRGYCRLDDTSQAIAPPHPLFLASLVCPPATFPAIGHFVSRTLWQFDVLRSALRIVLGESPYSSWNSPKVLMVYLSLPPYLCCFFQHHRMVSRASRQVLNVQVHSLGARRAALLRRHPLLAPALAEIQKWGTPELLWTIHDQFHRENDDQDSSPWKGMMIQW